MKSILAQLTACRTRAAQRVARRGRPRVMISWRVQVGTNAVGQFLRDFVARFGRQS